MRISTNMMFEQSTASLNRQQGSFLKVGQQLASGRRVVNPSDDPLATAKASSIAQSSSVNKQFGDARISARNSLGQSESVLGSVANAITSAKTLLVQAKSGTMTDSDRASIASELKGIYESLIGQANAADGNGRYLFAGFQDSTPPFVKNADDSVTYVGDANVVTQQVDSARFMPTTSTGSSVFLQSSGVGIMVARADDANTGTVRLSTPTLEDSTAADYRDPFEIEFSEVAGASFYSVNGGAAQPYVPGDKISASGYSVVLTGEPVAGDKISVGADADANTDLFKSLKDAIDVLETPMSNPSLQAKLSNVMNTVSNELTNSQDNVLTARASVGARLNELDVIDAVSDNRELNYTQSISKLIDLDYNKALSEYSLRQVGLQAAQKSFVDVQKLSLFNFI